MIRYSNMWNSQRQFNIFSSNVTKWYNDKKKWFMLLFCFLSKGHHCSWNLASLWTDQSFSIFLVRIWTDKSINSYFSLKKGSTDSGSRTVKSIVCTKGHVTLWLTSAPSAQPNPVQRPKDMDATSSYPNHKSGSIFSLLC